jgi:hypothetical protein
MVAIGVAIAFCCTDSDCSSAVVVAVDVVAAVVAAIATESSWTALDVTDVAAAEVDSADFTVRLLTCVGAGALAALALDS